MTTDMRQELYKKFVEKTHTYNQQRKKRSLPTARGLVDFLGNFSQIAELFELKNITKAHIIGLSAAMSHLKASESALGLYSDSFDDFAENLSKAVLMLTKKNPPIGTQAVVKSWLQFALMCVVGLLELAKERKQTQNEDPPMDIPFRNELLLKLLFYTNYPTILFTNMGEALEVDNTPLFAAIFETLALFFALIATSKEEETIRTELAETLSEKLKKAIRVVKEGFEHFPEETREIHAHVEFIDLVLVKQEFEELALALEGLLNDYGYPKETLFQDIKAMKELYKRLQAAYLASSENKSNMIHMLG